MTSKTSSSSILAAAGALTGGLLSSSCCVLQLLLNYTSIGCAGFSVLTPYSGLFRLATGGFLSYLLLSNGINRRTRTLSTAALSLLLMVSQDLLRAHNTGALQQLLQQRGLAQQAAAHAQQPVVVGARRTLLRVAGMRCEGCAARLRGNLAELEGVDACTVQFAAGTVEVWSNATASQGGVPASALLQAIQATDSSYTAEVLSRQCYDDSGALLQECPDAAAAAEDEVAAAAAAAAAGPPKRGEL